MKQNKNNPMLVAIAVVLLAIAGLLFWRYAASGREGFRESKPPQQAYEEQVQAIVGNPHMSPQAKETAIAQIRARFSTAPMQASHPNKKDSPYPAPNR